MIILMHGFQTVISLHVHQCWIRFHCLQILWICPCLAKAIIPNCVAFLCLIEILFHMLFLEYSLFKRTKRASEMLSQLINALKVLPIPSAECERGFSQMNLFHTSGRNRLLVTTVSALNNG